MGHRDARVAHAKTDISGGIFHDQLAPVMPAGIQRRDHSPTINPESVFIIEH